MVPFYYLVLSIAVLFLISFLFLFHKHRSNFAAANMPPGRIGWPIIGESLAFLSAGWDGCPEKFFFERAAKFPGSANLKVFKTSLMGEPTAIMFGAEANKFLFSNEEKLVRVWFPRSISKLFPFSGQTSESSKKEAMKLRKLLTNFLRPESLRQYIGVMDGAARRHFTAEWRGREEVVALPLAKRFAFSIAARLFMSLDEPEEVENLQKPFTALAAGVFSVPVDLPGTTLNRAMRAAATARKDIAKVIKRRKVELAGQDKDMLSQMMVTCTDDGRHMTELDVADKMLSLLVGSHDSISISCTFIVMYLADLPQIYNAVYDEQMSIAKSKAEGELLRWEGLQKMKYSWNVAQEMLRIVSPAQGTFREALTDFTFDGYSIPKGWKLFWSAAATHKNPSYFPNPDKFDPTRFKGSGPAPHTFVSFGGGPRMCPGREYARVKILVFMHNLVKRYRWEKIVPDEKITVNCSIPIPARGLPIRLFPHAYYNL